MKSKKRELEYTIEKRGIGHLEMITAMLIFIFAVVAVIYLMNLSLRMKISEPILDALESSFRKETEVEFTKIPFVIRSENEPDCFIISKHSDLRQEDLMFIVKGDNKIKFDIAGNNLLLERKGGSEPYLIYVFKEPVTTYFGSPSGECAEPDGGFNYGVDYHGKIFSQKKFTELGRLNYDELKSRFHIGNKDFEIIVTGGVGLQLTKKSPPKQVEIQARTFPIEIITENGDIVEGIVYIRVW